MNIAITGAGRELLLSKFEPTFDLSMIEKLTTQVPVLLEGVDRSKEIQIKGAVADRIEKTDNAYVKKVIGHGFCKMIGVKMDPTPCTFVAVIDVKQDTIKVEAKFLMKGTANFSLS